MRPLFHCALALALLHAFANAPHAHFHPEDPDHDHDHAVHHPASSLEHEPPGPHLEAADHDDTAQLLNWLAGDGSIATPLHAVLVSPLLLLPPPATRTCTSLLRVRNHDPPSLLHLPARAPPQ